MELPLRFHWSPDLGENTSDAAAVVDFCRRAEGAGVESVRVREVALATAAGMETSNIKFRLGIGCGADGVTPAEWAQQVMEAWGNLGARLLIHLRLENAESLAWAGEFLDRLEESERPEIHVEGETSQAAFLAIQRGDCLWRLPGRPEQVYADALPVIHFGKEVGLVSSVIARATRQEALEAASALHTEPTAIIGSFEEVAEAVHGFKRKSISQFLFRGWPDQQELMYFGSGVLPLVRALEGGK
jgi:alkanesulfonate monooxygenase SsuD/methylene tetrahydromethanopterin reductase-like flavin-dependent oxidoreductase (luciferase family)